MLEAILEKVITQVDEFQRAGQVRPAWLQKQADAVYLLETDPERGLALLADGLHDQLDALNKAEYRSK